MATKTSLQDHARKVLTTQHNPPPGEAPEPAEPLPPDNAFMVPAAGYTIRKRVTVPVLPFPIGATYVFRIMEAIHASDVEDSKFGPANVCQVESPNGEVRVLIANKVLQSELDKSYPSDGYVGAWFQVTKMPRREDKNYADFAIAEIEPPVASPAAEIRPAADEAA